MTKSTWFNRQLYFPVVIGLDPDRLKADIPCMSTQKGRNPLATKPIPSYDHTTQLHSLVPNYVLRKPLGNHGFWGCLILGRDEFRGVNYGLRFKFVIHDAAILDDPCLARFSGKPTNPHTHTERVCSFYLQNHKVLRCFYIWRCQSTLLSSTSMYFISFDEIGQDMAGLQCTITRCPLVIWHFAMDTIYRWSHSNIHL